jgi:hypothetical protein
MGETVSSGDVLTSKHESLNDPTSRESMETHGKCLEAAQAPAFTSRV